MHLDFQISQNDLEISEIQIQISLLKLILDTGISFKMNFRYISIKMNFRYLLK